MIPTQLQIKEFRFNLIKKGRKEPFEKNWQNVANYQFYDNKLQNYLKRGYNYGVLGGYGNLVIIDADVDEIQETINEKLPKTFTVQSNKGHHFYYICKDMDKPIRLRDVKTKGRAGKYGDIQWFGKFVIGVGSIHPSGSTYTTSKDIPIATISKQEITDALKDYIKDQPIEPLQEERQYSNRYKELKDLRITDVVNTTGLINKGGELQGTHPIHGSDTGLNFCVNPGKNVWHCFRHDTGGGPISWLAIKHSFLDCGDITKGAVKGKIFFDVMEAEGIKLTREIKAKIPEKEQDKIKVLRDIYNDDNKMGHYEIAQQLMNDYTFKTMEDNKEIYIYKEGIYVPRGDTIIMCFSEDVLGEEATNNSISEIIGHIHRRTITDRKNFDKNNVDYICLENGILNIKDSTLSDYDPKILFLNKLPVKYNPEAKIDKVLTFISEVMSKEDIPIIQEFLGYCLYKEMMFQKALMLVGEGRNGKSTLINIIKNFLGQENCSSISLQSLEARFYTAELYGKLVNLFADLSPQAMNQTGMFKILTGDDMVKGERKFKEPFYFTNYAKMIFSANRLPETPDDTDAFFRRWIIINFPNQFEGSAAKKGIIKELITENEMSGLLNWALEGLNRLIKDNDFSDNEDIKSIREKYVRMSNSAAAFSLDRLIISTEGYIEKKELYSIYTEYCREFKYPVFAENIFHKKLQNEIKIQDYRPRIDGLRVQTWRGISLNPDHLDKSLHTVNDVKVKSPFKIDRNKNNNSIKKEKEKQIALIENNPDHGQKIMDSKQIKDTLISLFAMEPEIEIQQFLTRYPKDFHAAIDIMLDGLKSDGEIFEPKPGFIKLLQ